MLMASRAAGMSAGRRAMTIWRRVSWARCFGDLVMSIHMGRWRIHTRDAVAGLL
jgi:hypothetical protein